SICSAANQTPQSLLQTDDCLRHAVFVEARTALLFDMTLPGGDDRIAWHCEGQLVDDDALQLLAAHVDTLPKTRGCKEHGIRCLPKSFQQFTLRCAALHETWIID